MVIASAEGLGAVLARVRALRIAVVAGVAVALGIVLVALFVPSARADAGTGTIQFTLKNVTGGGAPYGGCVEVYDVAQLKVAEDCTGYGDYSVTGLPDGSYRVKFTGFIDKAATQWYGPAADFAHATVIVIASGSAFSASATVLDPYSLAGRVVDSSGNPFTSGFVEVWGHDYDYDSYFPTRLVYTAEVGPDGWWATPGVGSCGTCQIHYRGFAGQANTWRIAYPAYDAPTSSLVVLNATPGHFSGTIAVPANFVGPSACVVLLTSEPGYGSWVEDTYCGAVGSPLAFDHVPPGRPYTVCVADTSGPTATCPNATSLWDFVGPGPTSTGTFTVAAGATVNIPLAFGGTVTSTPTLAGGGTPSGGCMDVYGAISAKLIASDCSPSDGTFSIALDQDSEWLDGWTRGGSDRYGLLVKFRDFKGAADAWNLGPVLGPADWPIKLSGGSTVNVPMVLAADLTPWGTISGDIALPAGSPDDHACVEATDHGGFSASVCTDPGETGYSIAVPPRPVWLKFYAESDATAFQLYEGVAAPSAATPVTVAAGQNRVIDANLAVAAKISGDVTLSNGSSALDGCVALYEADGHFVDSQCADGSGHYVLDNLPAGNYRLLFSGFTDGINTFFEDAADFDGARVITVAPGDAVTADMVLARTGTVSGTVTSPGGGPALGGCVVAYSASGGDPVRVAEDCVNVSGEYALDLAPGSYAILFANFTDGPGGRLQDEWNADAANSEAAVPVLVTDRGVTRVDAALSSGASGISAWLLNDISSYPSNPYLPATGGCSRIYDAAHALVTERCNARTNTWTAGIPAGQYRIEFLGYSYTNYTRDAKVHALADQWYDQQPTFDASDPVVVATGQNTNFGYNLLRGVSLHGSVAVPPGALLDGWVLVYETTTRSLAYWTHVDPDGKYSIEGIVPLGSQYRVKFLGFTGAADSWYQGGATWGDASVVAFPPGGGVALGAVTLAREGAITGTMNVPADFTGSYACVKAYYSDGYYVGEACGGVGEPFVIHNLPAGTVRLEFLDSTHTRLYRTDDWETAESYGVYAGVTTNAAIAWTVPTVTNVSPGFGPPAGGTVVTISGSGFSGATSVMFDGVAGTSLSVLSDSSLTVTTPPGTNSRAPIVVKHDLWDSLPADPAFFAYLDPAQSVVAGSPVRVLDASGFTSGVVRCYPVVGLGFVPDGAEGVLVNVTAVGPSGNGYVVVYPDTAGNGATVAPLASTVNFEPGRDVANSAMVALPSDGKVCAYSAGGTLSRLILDVAGYVVPGSGVTMQSAQRLLDTRQSGQQVTGPIEPNAVNTVQVTGHAGVPAGATAVVANLTVTGATDGGHLRVWAAGTPVPNTSVVNYAPGQTKANGQIIALSPSGALSFESFTGAGTSTNPVQVIIDVVGYVAAGSQFTATAPTRIVETRASEGVVGPIPGAMVPNTVYPVTLSDTSLIPSTATAVVLNVTAVGPTAFGNLRVYPDTNGLGTTEPPLASNLNYIPGRAIPNMVIVQIPPDRKIDFYNNQGAPSSRTHLIVDVIGYISAPTS